MVPNVISSGFKRSGIYPFNPQAISYGVVTKKSSDTTVQETSKSTKHCSGDTVNSDDEILNLSDEQVQFFEKRYEEGYDLPDPVYLKWLKITHHTVGQQIGSISVGEKGGSSANQEQHFQQCYEESQLPDVHPEQWNESVSLSELVCDSNSNEILGLECFAVEPVTASHVEDTSTTTSTDDLCP